MTFQSVDFAVSPRRPSPRAIIFPELISAVMSLASERPLRSIDKACQFRYSVCIAEGVLNVYFAYIEVLKEQNVLLRTFVSLLIFSY